MGNCQPVLRRRRSRRQSAEAPAIQSQPSSRSTQPTNSTSTGARDPHPQDGLPVSQSSRSATESLRAPLQGSTATSNRLHSPLQAPIDRTNATTQSSSANLAEPQNVGSAALPADSTERSINRETALSPNRRTVPLRDSAMARSTHQAVLERAGAQIGQRVTHPTQAASLETLPRTRNMAPRRERMMQETNATIVRTAPVGESSHVTSSTLNARRLRALGTEFLNLGVERAPVQATTARGMAPTTEPIIRQTSRPPSIRFHVQFPAARATSPEVREGEDIQHFVFRMITDRNAAVPVEHSRMFDHGFNRQDGWLLTNDNTGLAVIGMAFPPYLGKSVRFLFSSSEW